jgi:CRISPR-associated protein Csm5
MKNRFETCEVTLTPLSPIHISAGNPDYGWGAVWLPLQEKIFILDSERFSQKLVESNLFEKYIEEVEKWIKLSDSEKEKQLNPCFKFLQENSLQLFPNTDINKFLQDLSASEFNAPNGNRFIRNADGHAYIPGSSIKGAIRTAVIYAMLEEYKGQMKKDYLNDTYLKSFFDGMSPIPKNTGAGFDARKRMDEELLKSVFEDFELTEKDDSENIITFNRAKLGNGSITNLMRAILVSDSTPIPHIQKNLLDEEIKIVMLENPDLNGDRCLNRQALPYATNNNKKQCFEPNQQPFITFKITIDKEILRSFDSRLNAFPVVFKEIKDIEKIINAFYKKVYEVEQEYYLDQLALPGEYNSNEERMIENVLDFYDKNTASYPKLLTNINIGLGSGMLYKTLFVAIKEEYRIKIRNLQMTKRQIDNQRRGYNGRGNPIDWINKIAPNSRHLVFKNGIATRPLGWANLKFGSITYEDSVL